MKNQLFSIIVFTIFVFCKTSGQTAFQIDQRLNINIHSSIYGNAILETSDGGYIICGVVDTSFNLFSEYDGCIVKTDSAGNVQWTNVIDVNINARIFDVIELPSGNFAFTGEVEVDTMYKWRTLAGMISPAGSLLWLKYYDFNERSHGESIIYTFDHNLLIGVDYYDPALIKIDTLGNVIWGKQYGLNMSSDIFDVIQTSDSNYVFTGQTEEPLFYYQSVWLVKTNTMGDTLFTRTAGSALHAEGFNVAESSQHDLVVSGNTYDAYPGSDYDYITVRYSSNGNWLGSKVYSTPNEEACYGFTATNDSCFIIAGYAMLDTVNSDNWKDCFIKINSMGDTLWTKLYDHHVTPYGISFTHDGNILATGLSDNFTGPSFYSLRIMKLTGNGGDVCNTFPTGMVILDSLITPFELPTDVQTIYPNAFSIPMITYTYPLIKTDICSVTGINETVSVPASFNTFPNPSSGTFILSLAQKIKSGKVIIYNTLGEYVLEEILFDESKKEINLKNISSGLYFITVLDGQNQLTGKLMVIK